MIVKKWSKDETWFLSSNLIAGIKDETQFLSSNLIVGWEQNERR